MATVLAVLALVVAAASANDAARVAKGKIAVTRAADTSRASRPVELNEPVFGGDVIAVHPRFL